jgi:hypothetical protein
MLNRTNGLVSLPIYDSYQEFKKKKKACNDYQKNSFIKKDFDPEDAEEEISMSFAAGIKFSFKEKSGFSMQVLTPEQIAQEHIKASSIPQNLDVNPRKGSSLNIYC